MRFFFAETRQSQKHVCSLSLINLGAHTENRKSSTAVVISNCNYNTVSLGTQGVIHFCDL